MLLQVQKSECRIVRKRIKCPNYQLQIEVVKIEEISILDIVEGFMRGWKMGHWNPNAQKYLSKAKQITKKHENSVRNKEKKS